MKLLLDDGDEHVGGDGAPDLCLHGVLAGAQESLDTQVLLDPFEEQLDLPATFVERGNRQGGQRRVVGQKDQRLARFGVFESDAPQVLGVLLGRVMAVEHHTLVADDACAAVDRIGVHAPSVHARFGSGDEECASLMHGIQASKVDVSTIHHVKGARLDRQDVEYVDVVEFAVADVNERGNGTAQVQQRVQLDGGLGRTKRRPVEQAQAQVDGGGVQGVHTGIEIEHRWLLGIQGSGPHDQPLRQRMVNPPVARVQRIGQRRACWGCLQTHVKQLATIGGQAGFDVAQRFAPCELGKRHDAKQVRASQGANTCIAIVAVDDAREGLPRHELHYLCEQRLAHIHAPLRVVETREHRK